MGVMPEPVAKMKTWEAALGPAFSMRNPGPSTGLASTSVPAGTDRSLGASLRILGFEEVHSLIFPAGAGLGAALSTCRLVISSTKSDVPGWGMASIWSPLPVCHPPPPPTCHHKQIHDQLLV